MSRKIRANFRQHSAPMKTLRSLLLMSCAAFVIANARATTVIPPTFDQLVGDAELIFQGTVTDVRSQWIGEGAERAVVSFITFQIEDALKGSPGGSYAIRMLGGTIDGKTWEVTDAPKFKVGDRDILFVEHNNDQFVPLVGINNGRFHVQRDGQTGRDIVVNGEGEPVRDVTKFGREEESVSPAEAISPDQFKSAIQKQLTDQADRSAQ